MYLDNLIEKCTRVVDERSRKPVAGQQVPFRPVKEEEDQERAAPVLAGDRK